MIMTLSWGGGGWGHSEKNLFQVKTSKDGDDLVDWIRLVPARAENIDDFEMTMMMVRMMMIPMTMVTLAL